MSDEKHDPWALLREARESVEWDFDWSEHHDVASRKVALDLLARIDAALSEKASEPTFTRYGPFLEDQHGGKWWNETLLTLAQSDKANVAKVERIIRDNARAENDLTHALAEVRKLRAALELVAVEVSSQWTCCILCRTEYRGDEPSRVEHPHDRACALHMRSR